MGGRAADAARPQHATSSDRVLKEINFLLIELLLVEWIELPSYVAVLPSNITFFDFCCFICVMQPLSFLHTVSNCEVFTI